MNLSGLPERTQTIMRAIMANTAKLNGCAGPHDFTVDRTPEKKHFKRWACTKCAGEIEAIELLWYKRGLAHGLASTATSSPTTSPAEPTP